MKIGILGSGNVARALAVGFAETGHTVMVGSRNPEKHELQNWKRQIETQGISVKSLATAVEFGEVIVMALNWPVQEQVIELIGAKYFTDKIIIDPANAFDIGASEPGLLLKGHSIAEHLQKLLPDSQVVKALNMVAAPSMVRPEYRDGTPVMFIAGNNPSAKGVVTGLLKDIGWTFIVDAGSIAQSSYIEATVPLLAAFNYKANNNFRGTLTIIEK